MGFEVRVSFTGICALVVDTNPAEKRAVVVLPQAWNNSVVCPTKAADEKQLIRHRAFLSFPVHRLTGAQAVPSATEGIYYLNGPKVAGTDVRFVPTGANPPLTIPAPLDSLANLHDAAPDFSEVDSMLLHPNTVDSTRVTGRIWLDSGTLSTGVAPESWTIPGTLNTNGKVIEKGLSHELVVTWNGLTSFKISLASYAGTPVELEFKAGDKEKIKITIAHLCDQNPLRWETTAAREEMTPDDDFRWYYQLLKPAPYGDLPRALHESLDLPVPHLLRGVPSAQGINCFPANTKPQDLP